MLTRYARAVITYNGKNIMTDLKNFATSFSYSDPASGEGDTISVNIADPLGQWIGAWLPSKGDQIEAYIVFWNREYEGQFQKKDCGKFLLDDFSFSESGSGRSLTISAISAPLDEAFKATDRTKNWENVTIKQIAQAIADRYHMALVYDAQDIKLKKKEQSGTNDADFLESICKDYGLALKSYAKKIIIFDREKYKKKPALFKYDRSDCLSFSWNTTLAGTYTGGEIKYSSVKKNKTYTYSTGSGNRILKVNTRANSIEDAKLLLEAAIATENHKQTTASFSVIGDPIPSAGQCVLLTGFGQLSGKYYIDKKTENLGGSGYVSNFECSKINESDEEIACYAIDRLYALGVINSPDYWKRQLKNLKYLSDLFINADAAIKVIGAGTYKDAPTAIDALKFRGVINNADYWLGSYKKIANLDTLLIKLANASEDQSDKTKALTDQITEKVNDVTDTIKDTASDIIDNIKDTIGGVING